MKSYRNTVVALLLVFVLSASAIAADGIIYTEKTPPPPQKTNGIIYTEKAASTLEADTLTEIALTLLQSVLSLI